MYRLNKLIVILDWPGDLGLNANYALVFCQLQVGKHNYGVHGFFV